MEIKLLAYIKTLDCDEVCLWEMCVLFSVKRGVLRPGTEIRPRLPVVGVEVRALCRPVEFFHTGLLQPCLYGPHLTLEQRWAFPKMLPHSLCKISLYTAIKISLELTGRVLRNSPAHYRFIAETVHSVR